MGKEKSWGIKRNAKHIVRSAARGVRDRYAPKGKFNYQNIMSDVMMLKALVNVEKKRFNYNPLAAGALGQINVNASGHLCEDVTPIMAQGTGEAQRVGNSLKIHGLFAKIQFRNGFAQTARVRFIVELISVKGDPYTSMSAFVADYLQVNAFVSAYNMVGIYDWYSPRDPQNMTKFRRLVYKKVTMGGDTVSGQAQQAECTLKCKPGLHLKWNEDTDSTPGNGQLILLIRADRGNYGALSTLTGVSDIVAGSGYDVDRNIQYYLVDN